VKELAKESFNVGYIRTRKQMRRKKNRKRKGEGKRTGKGSQIKGEGRRHG
jgi:hypothetical protein